MHRDFTMDIRNLRLRFYHFRQRLRVAYLTLTHTTVDLGGVVFHPDRRLSPTIRYYLYRGDYEEEELAIVGSKLRSDDVVMELGTGLGLIATFCAKRIGSDRVFTYEANPSLEPLIRRTFEANHVSPSLLLCVLGKARGQQMFYIHKDFWASSTVPPRKYVRAIQVPVLSLCEELRRIRPTFLIVDIEGGELELAELTDFNGVRKICIEVHPQYIGHENVEHVRLAIMRSGFRMDHHLSTKSVWFLERPRRPDC